MRTVGRALLITFVILAIGITAYQFSTHNRFRLKSWEVPVAQVSMVEFKPGFDHPGNVWADFTIVNENAYPVKELQIHCDFRGYLDRIQERPWHQIETHPGPDLVYGFLTTAPNAVVAPIHPKAMPVILLTTDQERDCGMGRGQEPATALPDDALTIVARGTDKEDKARHDRRRLPAITEAGN